VNNVDLTYPTEILLFEAISQPPRAATVTDVGHIASKNVRDELRMPGQMQHAIQSFHGAGGNAERRYRAGDPPEAKGRSLCEFHACGAQLTVVLLHAVLVWSDVGLP
jgi:hypothetical protein